MDKAAIGVTLGLVGILGGGAAALWWLTRPVAAESQPATEILYEDAPAPAPPAPRVLLPPLPYALKPGPATKQDDAKALATMAAKLAAPFATQAASQALTAAGNLVSSASANVATASSGWLGYLVTQDAAHELGTSVASGVQSATPLGVAGGIVGGALTSGGGALGEINPIVGVIGVNAALAGFRGASQSQQAAILGKATVDSLATAIGASVPLVGAAIAKGLAALAGTYEGARAVKAVGVAEEQGYTAQKQLFSGQVSEAFSGGGTSHKERVEEEAQAIAANGKLADKLVAGKAGAAVADVTGQVHVDYGAKTTAAQTAAERAQFATQAAAATKLNDAQNAAIAADTTRDTQTKGGLTPLEEQAAAQVTLAAKVNVLTQGGELPLTPALLNQLYYPGAY